MLNFCQPFLNGSEIASQTPTGKSRLLRLKSTFIITYNSPAQNLKEEISFPGCYFIPCVGGHLSAGFILVLIQLFGISESTRGDIVKKALWDFKRFSSPSDYPSSLKCPDIAFKRGSMLAWTPLSRSGWSVTTRPVMVAEFTNHGLQEGMYNAISSSVTLTHSSHTVPLWKFLLLQL